MNRTAVVYCHTEGHEVQVPCRGNRHAQQEEVVQSWAMVGLHHAIGQSQSKGVPTNMWRCSVQGREEVGPFSRGGRGGRS